MTMRPRQKDRTRDQPGVQHAAAEARHVPDQSRLRLRDVATSTAGSTSPGRTPWRWPSSPTRWSSRRWCRWRAGRAGAARPIRRGRASRPTPGPPASRRSTAQGRRDLDLAHHHQPSDHRGQAVGGDRPHLERPLHAQRRHRLGAAGDRDVRPADALPRGALRLRRGMARDRQAAVDRGRVVRPRGPLLQDQEGLSGAEADPVPLPRDHERRRLRARPALSR